MKIYSLRKSNGFTLVEVLIAGVASGVMVLGLIGGASGFFSRDSQERQQILTQQRLRLVTSQMASDIRQAGYIYQNPTTASALIGTGTIGFPASTTPILAVIVPNQINGAADPNGNFILVIYATGPIPNVAPFNSISSMQGNVIYRWYSQPEAFDPRTQTQGNGNLPNALNLNFKLYGGANTDTVPPILTSNINTITLNAPAATFGPTGMAAALQSATGETVSIQAYTGTGWAGKVPTLTEYLQPRNLGLPPAPLPSSVAGAGGNVGGCVSNPVTCD
ncbi:MAG: prepilin-type N-terminal cleavage/methylation domain-containing protein [Gloeobacterales cyanobacterium]